MLSELLESHSIESSPNIQDRQKDYQAIVRRLRLSYQLQYFLLLPNLIRLDIYSIVQEWA